VAAIRIGCYPCEEFPACRGVERVGRNGPWITDLKAGIGGSPVERGDDEGLVVRQLETSPLPDIPIPPSPRPRDRSLDLKGGVSQNVFLNCNQKATKSTMDSAAARTNASSEIDDAVAGAFVDDLDFGRLLDANSSGWSRMASICGPSAICMWFVRARGGALVQCDGKASTAIGLTDPYWSRPKSYSPNAADPPRPASR